MQLFFLEAFFPACLFFPCCVWRKEQALFIASRLAFFPSFKSKKRAGVELLRLPADRSEALYGCVSSHSFFSGAGQLKLRLVELPFVYIFTFFTYFRSCNYLEIIGDQSFQNKRFTATAQEIYCYRTRDLLLTKESWSAKIAFTTKNKKKLVKSS
jgi:hypothetical protein